MNKAQALKKLAKLDEEVVVRLAELSDNPKALNYFKSSVMFALVKGFLK
ncbi:hypothetical protein [Tenacibaculum sp. 190524A02b]